MSKVHVCDSCQKVITEWEKVVLAEHFTGYAFEFCGATPLPAKTKVKLELCKPCYDELMKYLKACAGVRNK